MITPFYPYTLTHLDTYVLTHRSSYRQISKKVAKFLHIRFSCGFNAQCVGGTRIDIGPIPRQAREKGA